MPLFRKLLLAATTAALVAPISGALGMPAPASMHSAGSATAGASVPAVGVLALAGAPAGAYPIRLDGERLYEQAGKVRRVLDGDTVTATLKGRTGTYEIRNSGIQALEKNQCHYESAERGLKTALRKGNFRVFLRSYADSRNRGRLLRHIFLRNGRDIQAVLLRKGLVLPYTLGDEVFRQVRYSRIGQRAALRGVGMYDTDTCGKGPSQNADLRVMVNYDADGSDKGYADKYLIVRNLGPVDANIGGWRIRSATKRSFRFPSGTVVAPGTHVKVELRPGTSTSTVFHWPEGAELFHNPGNSKKYKVGGGYLFDPDWDLRAWSFYPCQVNCGHPATGKVGIKVDWKAYSDPNDESVTFTNGTGGPLDLSYLVAEVRYAIYMFPPGTTLAAGESLRMKMGRGTDTRTLKHLSNESEYARSKTNVLPSNGWVILRTHESERIACTSWGDVRCSQRP